MSRIRSTFRSILGALVAPIVTLAQTLRDIIHHEPSNFKRRAVLVLVLPFWLVLALPLIVVQVLRYTWGDFVDNVNFVAGDIPHDIRARWSSAVPAPRRPQFVELIDD